MHLFFRLASRLLILAGMLPFLCRSLEAIPVRVLAWDQNVASMRLAFGDHKGSGTPIEAMHPSKRTKAYEVSMGKDPLVIQSLDHKDADGKPCTSAIEVPAEITQPLLVILPDAKAASGLRLFVLEDNTTNFAWGSTRFINATGQELACVCGNKSLVLPASWTPAQSDPGGPARNLEVKLFFHGQPERPFYSSLWEYDPDQRMLVFLVPGTDPRLGPVGIKAVPEDRRQALAAAEAGPAKAGDHQP